MSGDVARAQVRLGLEITVRYKIPSGLEFEGQWEQVMVRWVQSSEYRVDIYHCQDPSWTQDLPGSHLGPNP